jgi:biopolymer transport protein ExbB
MQVINNLIELGGPVAMLLLVFSVLGLSVAFVKLWQFWSLGIGNTNFISDTVSAWQSGERNKAITFVENVKHPVAKVLFSACSGQGDASSDLNREETLRIARSQLESMRSYMRVLEVIAALSPLLGLFGTVLGMIKAFQKLELAGSNVDPSILSGGIWEALLTTAIGLAVAIPAVLLVNYFDRIIDRTRHQMEDAATQIFVANRTSVA